MPKRSTIETIMIGVAITVFSAIILYLVSAIFISPTAVKIIDQEGIFCPKNIYSSYNENISFKVAISNKGKSGGIMVALESEDPPVRSTIEEDFSNIAKKDKSEYSRKKAQAVLKSLN